MTLQQIAALILQAATSLGGILPIVSSVEALVAKIFEGPSTHLPKKADGTEYTALELTNLVIAMQDEAHQAWHSGDAPAK